MPAALKHKILRRERGLLFYGLTSPKMRNESQKIAEIVTRQMERLHPDSLGSFPNAFIRWIL